MLSTPSVQRINGSTGWRARRIEFFDLPEGAVVVKGQRAPRSAVRVYLQQMLMRLGGQTLLQPVPARGGYEAQNTEVRRLQQLAQAGVRVPQLLHVAQEYIVMQRLQGQTLHHYLTQEPSRALAMFRQGLRELAALHANGQYLSQAFTRNTLVVDGDFYYIDFEDDPSEVLSLVDAQARDVCAYLLSSVWCIHAPHALVLEVWTEECAHMAGDLLVRLRQVSHGLRWLRHLPRQRPPWGRDVVALGALAQFMVQWQSAASVH